ncbi:bacterio-opsin activator domain-containing protein [Halomarina litorea]|uniref:bacterio-opsin activator domain-containing protein n=1 Tax=Halomarina litorea TaxID=2961595 RepID=UPI0020C1FB99|nr:bacterio-opsin activator domain-containing protein [Halomarina sp. BCD28]
MLLIGPDEATAGSYAAPLERAGFRVETTTTPADCLDRIAPSAECVVCTDRLDGTTGLSVLRAVRAAHPDLPFVLVATDGDERLASEAVSAGVTEYVPAGDGVPPDLVERVRSAVGTGGRRGETAPDVAAVYERISDAFYAVDESFRFVYVNERARELLQAAPADLLGRTVWEAFPETRDTVVHDALHDALATQTPTTFDLYYDPIDSWVDACVYPSATGLSVYLRDVTERKRRERALRDAYEVIADPERTFADRVDDLLEVGRDVLGVGYATLSYVRGEEYVFEAVAAPPGADLAVGETVPLETTNCERVVATEETLVLRDVETDAPELADRAGNAEWGVACYLGAPVALGDEVCGTLCFYDMEARSEAFSDWEVTFVDLLSNWVSRELDQQRHTEQFAALDDAFPDLGFVVDGEGRYRDYLAGPAAAGSLAVDREDLLGRTVDEVLPGEAAESLLAAVREATATGRLQTVEYDRPVGGQRRCFEARVAPLTGSEYGPETTVVVARDVTERRARERALERQRDELAKLHRIDALTRGITGSLQNAATRDAIEAAVCEHLTESDLYRTAWVGTGERSTAGGGPVTPRTVAGAVDAREGAPGADGPAAAALQSEPRNDDGPTDTAGPPAAREDGEGDHPSLAAVPLTTDATTYGVLVVEAPAGETIDDAEREVLADLGRTIALAIQRVESQRSLTAATAVELRFRVPDDTFGEVTAGEDGRLVFERRVPVGDGRRLYYFAVPDGDPSRVGERLAANAAVDACAAVGDGEGADGSALLEVALATDTATAIDVLVEQGASVVEARVEAGDLHVTAEVAPRTDVRAIVDALQEATAAADLVGKRSVERPVATAPERGGGDGGGLTAKQRAALGVALARGYYEWPRASTAEEIARTMDVSSATFHYHLRHGLRTVLTDVLDRKRG